MPVDLDEILPASKQKKLILPFVSHDDDRSPARTPVPATDDSISKLKQQNESDLSLNTANSRSERKRRGPSSPPELDLNYTRLLCSTTPAALSNYTSEELQAHVAQLKDLHAQILVLQDHWTSRMSSAEGDKAAFEEVIENLVKHAKKIRK